VGQHLAGAPAAVLLLVQVHVPLHAVDEPRSGLAGTLARRVDDLRLEALDLALLLVHAIDYQDGGRVVDQLDPRDVLVQRTQTDPAATLEFLALALAPAEHAMLVGHQVELGVFEAVRRVGDDLAAGIRLAATEPGPAGHP